jgi:hypothetical protein
MAFNENEDITEIETEARALVGEVLPGPGPGGGQGPEAGPDINTGVGDLITTIMILGGEYVASRAGEHWKFTAEEAQQVGKAWDKWAATQDVQMSPFWTALGITGAVIFPRALTTMMQAQTEEEGGEDAKDAAKDQRQP